MNISQITNLRIEWKNAGKPRGEISPFWCDNEDALACMWALDKIVKNADNKYMTMNAVEKIVKILNEGAEIHDDH